MRRSKGKRREVVQHGGTQNRKFRSNPSKTRSRSFGTIGLLIIRYAELSFDVFASVCCKMHLVPFFRDNRGRFDTASLSDVAFHLLMMFVYLLCIIQKLLVCAKQFLYQESFTLTTFLSVAALLLFIVPCCTAVGILTKPYETVELLNSWAGILANLDRTGEEIPTVFSGDVPASARILGIAVCAVCVMFIYPCVTLAFQDIPYIFGQALKDGRLFPAEVLPFWPERLLFLFAELILSGISIALMVFASQIVMIGIGTIKIYIMKIRELQVIDKHTHSQLLRLYILLLLHNKVYSGWMKVVFVPSIFSQSCGTILTLFIAFKYRDIPIVFTFILIYVALTLVGIVFWGSYDAVTAIRVSECIIEKLRQGSAQLEGFKTGSVELRRARALRPLALAVGNFGDFSMAVPETMWDEILNQLLFLLSL